MKIVFFGYNQMGWSGLKATIDGGYDVALVVTHKDNPKEKIWFESVAGLANSHDIPVITPDDTTAHGFIEAVNEIAPDLILSIYFRNMFPPELLSIPGLGAMNLHGSFLPKFRGRVSINWAIIEGEAETGITLHYMDEKPDHGAIIGQKRVKIEIDDTAKSLHRKMAREAYSLIAESLPLIEAGKNPRTPQDHSKSTYYGARGPEDGRIDWGAPAIRVYNLIRAVTDPYPGAFTEFRGKRLFVWWGEVKDGDGSHYKPGEILPADDLIVACGEGLINLTDVQLVGDRRISGGQFMKKHRVAPGETLGQTTHN